MNVRLGWTNQPLDGDQVKWRDLNRQSGILASSLENGVPEQMFSTATQSVQGVSAVKALALASQQGQRIYHITPQNQAQTLPNLHLGGLAMSEIQKGLATGKEIIAHTDPINVSGWVGEGYLILDPDTGSGAYKISGGLNGGFMDALPWILKGIITLKVTQALVLGLSDIARTISRFGNVASYVLGIFDIITKCTNADPAKAQTAVVAYTLVSWLQFLVTTAVFAFAGPVAWLVAGIVIGNIVAMLRNYMIESWCALLFRNRKFTQLA